tara:strand:- start:787 stop:1218 length:432 start_codon:yes stop_codon:yes gene_type:complete
MIDLIHKAFMAELRKIASEGQQTQVENQSSDVDSAGGTSPAVREIFNMKELTRVRQEKDEKGKPSSKAHSSPVITDREAAQKLHDAGRKEGYQVGAQQGLQHAATVGKKSYESGYQSAAKKGLEIAAQSYMKGRNATNQTRET